MPMPDEFVCKHCCGREARLSGNLRTLPKTDIELKSGKKGIILIRVLISFWGLTSGVP